MENQRLIEVDRTLHRSLQVHTKQGKYCYELSPIPSSAHPFCALFHLVPIPLVPYSIECPSLLCPIPSSAYPSCALFHLVPITLVPYSIYCPSLLCPIPSSAHPSCALFHRVPITLVPYSI
ncbi:predicted protein [Nematostella vectensis]|uniref:Uncharacterized protein n=2 Tax=Nematostella vectensis TaxID=45351 RepID=A7S9V4_NEMVE|nr:predicted protein [Nematostella vectensis]|eukprot:XP_001631552.1 predicted protein [Nematostella vectensis]